MFTRHLTDLAPESWPGTINLRPVAAESGLPLLRTGSLQCVSVATAAKLQRLANVTTYVDLRTPQERGNGAHRPSIVECGSQWIQFPIEVMGPPELNGTRYSDASYAAWYGAMADRACAAASLVLQHLRDMAHRRPAETLLFGCSAGKDRSGLVAAALLAAMGAPCDIIRRDFLRSEMALQSARATLQSLWPEASLQANFTQRMRPREPALMHFLAHPTVLAFVRRWAAPARRLWRQRCP